MGCEHVESANPRKKGCCEKCGRTVGAMTLSLGLARDREFERELTREMTAGLAIDPEPLITFAERRADQFEREYGHDFPSLDRDLEREAIEEGADLRNYLCWKLDKIRRGLAEGEEWKVPHLQTALRHTACVFEEVRACLTVPSAVVPKAF